ncbi:MAG TPA: hypothetical protein EYO66_08085 [Gammaproteobacteria bacterium]|nr:hypothetical protein [Gammaproteobacteria bacterium]
MRHRRTPAQLPSWSRTTQPVHMSNQRSRKTVRQTTLSGPLQIALVTVILIGGMLSWPEHLSSTEWQRSAVWGVDRHVISDAITPSVQNNTYPREITITSQGRRLPATIHYNTDRVLRDSVNAIFEKYGPDYGMFVGLDPDTGKILALVNHRRKTKPAANFALQATYPSASVFKLVTASAAIDLGKVNADTVIPFNGKTTSLYRQQVLHHKDNQWTRHLPLKMSFAKSVNSVFGRLGVQHVGGKALLDYAQRLGFNREIKSDVEISPSRLALNLDNPWSIVEAASGWTQKTTMSPVHAAVLAAATINGGFIVQPSLVDAITDTNGIVLYADDEPYARQVFSESTAHQLQNMMTLTVRKGSAKKSFNNFFTGKMSNVEVGGKTGTLNGTDPAGTYDWFVGYAKRGDRKLAYAVLCINKEKWYVKSAYVARIAIEHYFSEQAL